MTTIANTYSNTTFRQLRQRVNEIVVQTNIIANNSGSLTVSEIDTYNALTNIVSGVKTLRFDKDTGFQVTSLGNNSVKISLGSSFKTWNVTGQPSLVAQGEDTVRFVGNNGISITTSNTAGNKKITFNGHLANTNAYIANRLAYVTTTVQNIAVGDSLSVTQSFANTTYPAGYFTITKLGAESSTFTNTWGTASTNKNQYTDYSVGTVNTQNIIFTISLTNATFNIQAGDTISLAGVTILTGASLLALGISGTGGTYTLSSSNFSSAIQIRSSTAVTYSLTTNRSVRSGSGTTLTGNAPGVYNVGSVSASWQSNPVAFWSTTQSFNWQLNSITGSTTGGTTTYAGGSSGTLTSAGATSGSSSSLNSTLSYTLATSSYTGTGTNGAGTATSTNRSGSLSAASVYYPLFWKTTQSSSNPSLTTSDSHNNYAFATGQTVTTTANAGDYTWIATPTSASRTFKYIFLGSDVSLTATTTYTSQTISGTTYNVYGFTNFSSATVIYVVT